MTRRRVFAGVRALRRVLFAMLAATACHAHAQTAAERICPPPVALPDVDQARAEARDRGPLWRLSRDGRVSYLYGTLHVGRPAWVVPGPALTKALRETDVLALELDPADAGTRQALHDMSQSAPVLTPALRARLDAMSARACLPDGALGAMHPMLQAIVLAMLEARWDGLDVAFAQEQILAALVRTSGREVRALETASLQTQALIPNDPAALLRAIDQTLSQLESGTARSVVRRLVTAWESGDLETLSDYERWCECAATDDDRAQLRRLNDDRNPALAQGVDALHAAGRGVLVAVGALHMTGPAGLPRLLADKGFVVERIH